MFFFLQAMIFGYESRPMKLFLEMHEQNDDRRKGM
jgi:hypothetical protein